MQLLGSLLFRHAIIIVVGWVETEKTIQYGGEECVRNLREQDILIGDRFAGNC